MGDKAGAHPALAELTKLAEKGDGFIVASTLEGESVVRKDGKVDAAATRAKEIAALRLMQEINEERRGKDPKLPKLQIVYVKDGKEVDGSKLTIPELSEYGVKLTRVVDGKPDGVIALSKKEAEFDYSASLKEQGELFKDLVGKRVKPGEVEAKLAETKRPYIEAQKIWDAINTKARPELQDLLLESLKKVKPADLKNIDEAFQKMFGSSIVSYVEKNTAEGSAFRKKLLELVSPLTKPKE